MKQPGGRKTTGIAINFEIMCKVIRHLPVYTGMNDYRNRIISLLESVERPGMGNVIRFLNESTFFDAPCCRHHRFQGGLAAHSLEVYDVMKGTNPLLNGDSVIIASLLHDVCKARHHKGGNIEGHGKRSVRLLTEVCGLELTKDEYNAILNHMHPFAKGAKHSALGAALVLGDNVSAAFGAKERA